MKIQKLSLSILILWGCCFAVCCKKDKAAPKNPVAVSPPEQEQLPGVYVPKKLSTGKANMLFGYTKSGALTKVDYENGDSTVLKYNAEGKPLEFSCYETGKLILTTYYSRNADGWIIKAQTYKVTGKDQVKTGSYTVTYSGSQIAAILYYNKDNRLLEEQQYSYTAAGNLTAQKSPLLTANYSYDLKNGLFKNVGYAWLFALEKENSLFLSGVNNIQNCSYPAESVSNQQLSYTYNTDGYPTAITITALGLSATTKVSY